MTNLNTSPFEGEWNVESALLPNGNFAYNGLINFSKSDDLFTLRWRISAGEYIGIGLVHDSHLYVSCGKHPKGMGIALFTREADHSIKVQWNTPEMEQLLGAGEFTSPWKGDFEGQHQLKLQGRNESLMGNWSLSIHKIGDVYEVSWKKDDGTMLSGLGFITNSGFVTGWYPEIPQLAFMDYQMDHNDLDRMTAVWALGGYSKLGTEVLSRNR